MFSTERGIIKKAATERNLPASELLYTKTPMSSPKATKGGIKIAPKTIAADIERSNCNLTELVFLAATADESVGNITKAIEPTKVSGTYISGIAIPTL